MHIYLNLKQFCFAVQDICTNKRVQWLIWLCICIRLRTSFHRTPRTLVSMILLKQLRTESFQQQPLWGTHSSPQHLNILVGYRSGKFQTGFSIPAWWCLGPLLWHFQGSAEVPFLITSETSVSEGFQSLLLLQLCVSCILILTILNCFGGFFALTILSW